MSNEEFFLTGSKRKEKIAKVTKHAIALKNGGREAALESFEDLNSGLLDIGHSFWQVLPERTNLKDYIEGTLQERKGEVILVEFGGIAVELSSGFSPGFLKKSIGVVLVDHREPEQKGHSFREETGQHKILEGDILSPKFYSGILERELRKEKVDLIIERMIGGLRFIPDDPYILTKILKIWYKLLRERGIMFVQVNSTLRNLLTKWSKLIKSEYKDKIELEINFNSRLFSVFRLRKLSGAPIELPLLDRNTLKGIEVFDHWEHFV